MHANSTVMAEINDPAEIAYWNHRTVVRRRQLLVFLISVILTITFVVWKVARHLSATLWLEANQYVVLWSIDKENWKQGGSTTVRYSSPQFNLFSSERPVFDLKFLKNLHSLEELDLSTLAWIRDVDLVNLGDLTALQRLNLDRSRHQDWIKASEQGLTDSTLTQIGRLTRLVDLNLGGQKITDAGLKDLAGLDQLRSLDLVETEITDAGLEHLKALRGLKSLDLSRTKVTAQGVSNFEAARPGVRVLSDPPPTVPTPKIPR
jgi:hypothetical protein